MNHKYALLTAIFLLLIISCKKNAPTTQPEPPVVPDPPVIVDTKPGLYITTNSGKAGYWLNDEFISLSNSKSATRDILVNGKDVYICGSYYSGTKNEACYWKNNTLTLLPGTQGDAEATAIVVQNNTVLVAGSERQPNGALMPVYWKDGVKIALVFSGKYGEARGIALQGNDVYICGYIIKDLTTLIGQACCWKNDKYVELSVDAISSSADGIAINGADVYIIGNTSKVGENANVPVYWKNGMADRLVSTYGGCYATDITINKSDFYISGSGGISPFVQSTAVYWKNGFPTYIPGTIRFNNSSILVNGSDIYLCGSYKIKPADTVLQPAYSKNGTMFNLSADHGSPGRMAIVTP